MNNKIQVNQNTIREIRMLETRLLLAQERKKSLKERLDNWKWENIKSFRDYQDSQIKELQEKIQEHKSRLLII